MSKAEPRLQRSGVVKTETGGTEVNDIRTSHGMFFGRGEDVVIQSAHGVQGLGVVAG